MAASATHVWHIGPGAPSQAEIQAMSWVRPDGKDPSATGLPAHQPAFRSPLKARYRPILKLSVPLKGTTFMTPTTESIAYAEMNGTYPVYDQLLHGTFEASLEESSPPLRIRDVRVGIRVESKLDLGGDRNGEIDELFSREERYVGEDEKDIILTDTLKFAFTLTIPSDTAPRDFHPNGIVAAIIYGEMRGEPIEGTPIPEKYPVFLPDFPSLPQKSSIQSTGSKTTSSWIPFRRSKRTSMPVVKELEKGTQCNGGSEAVWLEGSHSVARILRLVYNPNISGGISVLNEVIQGSLPHVGPYHIRLYSDVWTIASLLQSTLALTDLTPGITIFSFRVALAQTHRIQSPRDGPLNAIEVVKTRRFLLIEEGVTPETHMLHPPPSTQALWRGTKAGGSDDGPFILETRGRVRQSDLEVRPSTLPGIVTPIHVDHDLEVSVYFSIYGVDPNGMPMKMPGAGGVQCMRIRRKINLPPCQIIPSLVRLPDYHHPDETEHDPYEDLVNAKTWCSCTMSLETIVERMQAAVKEEEKQAEESKGALSAKQEAERSVLQ